ncbi:hypothetical protein [Marivirga lumbricoides]|uniref:hypothetical protein n=1 Tax=Marivirga lumbricoides TaxID=1046115 RepID=UPI001E48E92F
MTKKPIQDVAIGKTDTTDLDNPFNRKTMTGKNEDYEVDGIAGTCDEITMYFNKEGYEPEKITFQNNSIDTILLQPITRKQTTIFDFNCDFEIINLQKLNQYPASDPDTTTCINWNLNKLEVKKNIRESQISGPEWHYMFGHYPCRIHGKILQDSVEFEYSINSGAWLTISLSDTTLLLGSFKEENNNYFQDTVWSEEEML